MSEKLRVGILGATGMVFLFWRIIRGLKWLPLLQAREVPEKHMKKL